MGSNEWSAPATASAVIPLEAPAEKGRTLYMPPGTVFSDSELPKVLMNIVGPSGAGKSWLVNQMRQDPEYAREDILVLMNEQATASYGYPLPPRIPVTSLASTQKALIDLYEASLRGYRLPKILFWDSLTGATDYTQAEFSKNPNMVFQKESQSWVRDKRSEYGDLGGDGRDIYLLLRKLPMDVIVLITSHEGAFSPMPEIACEGKLIPKNISRWSSATLYLKAEEKKFDAADVDAIVAQEGIPQHRSIGVDPNNPMVKIVINRYFVTQNTGEITAKGHVSLGLREPAVLPEVLRKIKTYNPGGKS